VGVEPVSGAVERECVGYGYLKVVRGWGEGGGDSSCPKHYEAAIPGLDLNVSCLVVTSTARCQRLSVCSMISVQPWPSICDCSSCCIAAM